MTRRLRILSTVAALSLWAAGFSPTIVLAEAPAANAASQISRGGEITVNRRSAGTVALASDRFTCESCAEAVIPRIKALSGVLKVSFGPLVGSSKNGPVNGLIGVLTVTFDPAATGATQIAQAAKTALEADPYNHATVTVVEHATK
ncbi:MAG: hypothetical protein NVSMB5_14750 [Candidatus Velthaea sp.]